jgi:hypothetical protein
VRRRSRAGKALGGCAGSIDRGAAAAALKEAWELYDQGRTAEAKQALARARQSRLEDLGPDLRREQD